MARAFIFQRPAARRRIYRKAGAPLPTVKPDQRCVPLRAETNVLITEKQNLHDHPTLVYCPSTLNGSSARGGWLFCAGKPPGVRGGPARHPQSTLALTPAKNKASSPTQRFIAPSPTSGIAESSFRSRPRVAVAYLELHGVSRTGFLMNPLSHTGALR